MRKIKFRAWDKERNEMFFPETENNSDTFFTGFNKGVAWCSESQYDDEQDYPLMQYVGCKDKNGIEIYEGDIIRGVCFVHAGDENPKTDFGDVVSSHARWNLREGRSLHAIASYTTGKEGAYLEVAGNIYQNPDLLEAK